MTDLEFKALHQLGQVCRRAGLGAGARSSFPEDRFLSGKEAPKKVTPAAQLSPPPPQPWQTAQDTTDLMALRSKYKITPLSWFCSKSNDLNSVKQVKK